MLKRILVAIPIIIIVALALFVQSWVLAIFAVILACMSQFEVVRAMDGNGKPVVKWVSYLFAGLLAVDFAARFVLYYYWGWAVAYDMSRDVVVLFVIMVMLTFAASMFSEKHTAQSISNTILTLVYPQLFFVLFYMLILSVPAHGAYFRTLVLLLMVFLPAMFTDTFAYFFGMAFGKRKLCPSISPKKTVAGCVAGLAGGVVAAFLIWLVFSQWVYVDGSHVEMAPLVSYIVAGAILAVIAQIGDLSASFLKRAFTIKDFGKLLPGHGGVVDRVDSIMFCIPVVYLLSIMSVI
ncbi:MAG: phosphatidate cytidylyltransferase [Christensenella sp.]|uniref:phosphatidate cytidylyltransferase n=1 Tax=Christensenella sp. TaxID=1935934 RepID=UPI002B213E96|nr:phosphatidate cytidylyltransferase [Christensenella sp.]MEA5002065.1 phosphatidate cytidylyltransferase [Christensenella sp.]